MRVRRTTAIVVGLLSAAVTIRYAAGVFQPPPAGVEGVGENGATASTTATIEGESRL